MSSPQIFLFNRRRLIEVGNIARARTFAGYRLQPGESYVLLARVYDTVESVFPWVTTPLGSGATGHVVNAVTGIETPYTIPAGYDFIIFLMLCNRNQNAIIRAYIDGELAMTAHTKAYHEDINQPAISTSIAMVDPYFENEHTYDLQVTNVGAEVLKGREWQVCIQVAMGTKPLPKDVDKQCKWCGKKVKVKLDKMRIKCKKCSKETWFISPYYRGF